MSVDTSEGYFRHNAITMHSRNELEWYHARWAFVKRGWRKVHNEIFQWSSVVKSWNKTSQNKYTMS